MHTSYLSITTTLMLILQTVGIRAFASPFSLRRLSSLATASSSSKVNHSSITRTTAAFASPVVLPENITDSTIFTTKQSNPASSSLSSSTIILAQDSQFIKSLPDKRQYRAITLPNSLTVLLTSDPNTDVEAASVHVRAGHFDDPANRAGLAHFHEHMLFLGTEKYPKEEEYEGFLGRNGGMSNAYTDMEDTNYYFNVAPLDHDEDEEDHGGEEKVVGGTSSALSGALDRFAQFFISPLLTRVCWNFGCGNYNTLTDGGDPLAKKEGEDTMDFGGGSSPREALIDFWTNKYHAGNLRLCVIGRASLDDLQRTVEKSFGSVRSPPPNFVANGIADQIKAGILKVPNEGESHLRDENGDFVFQTEHFTYAPNVAFGPDHLGLIREVVPLVESRSLKIFSAVPPLDDPVLRGSRPFSVLSHLVGHESPGSLHHLLMEEGWINSLSSGTGISSTDFCLITISIALTPKGLRERDQVLAKTWQWLFLIKDSVANDEHGLIEQYHNELRKITETSFKYREMGDPTDFCSAAAERLFDYEPSKILVGSAEYGEYDAEVARAFLNRMTPQNSLVVVTAPELEKEEQRSPSLVQVMVYGYQKRGDERGRRGSSSFGSDVFEGKENLLRQTKNYIFDSPYETGSYNLRVLLETPVWHVNDYIAEMEGPDADAEPLTLKECAEAAEQCLFGRSKAVSLCIGNINEKEAKEVAEVIQENFLNKRPLFEDETPRFRALKLPDRAEAMKDLWNRCWRIRSTCRLRSFGT
eukprot:g13239.t1 g13239   contig8:228642-231771(-)